MSDLKGHYSDFTPTFEFIGYEELATSHSLTVKTAHGL